MADLPSIPNPNPITIPAVDAVAYDSLYIVAFDLGIEGTDGATQPICVTFRPYSYTAKKLYPDNTRDVVRTYPNAWLLAAQHPLAAQVIGGLVQLLTLEFQLGNIEATVTAAQVLVDTANARLAQIVAALATATDAQEIASLTSEQTAITESLPTLQASLDTATTDANTAKTPILTALGL
jgi:hypothetical protein